MGSTPAASPSPASYEQGFPEYNAASTKSAGSVRDSAAPGAPSEVELLKQPPFHEKEFRTMGQAAAAYGGALALTRQYQQQNAQLLDLLTQMEQRYLAGQKGQ